MRFNEPMRYGEFKQLSNRTKKEYIQFLRERYNVTNVALCDMLGCTFKTLRKQLDSLEADFGFTHGNKMNREEKEAWAAFLSGGASDNDVIAEESDIKTECAAHEPIAAVKTIKPDDAIHIHRCAGGVDEVLPASQVLERLEQQDTGRVWSISHQKTRTMNMSRMEVEFNGEINAADLANFILFAVGNGETARVKVVVER